MNLILLVQAILKNFFGKSVGKLLLRSFLATKRYLADTTITKGHDAT